jgi:nitroreductase
MNGDAQVLMDIIKERRSIRRFSSQPLEQEKLDLILEAARWAPSAGNSQPWEFVVIARPHTIRTLRLAMPGVMGNIFEITAFQISSAKRCLGPEANYGSARLVQAMNLLSHLPEHAPELHRNSLLSAVQDFVEGDPHWWYEDKLEAFIDRLSDELLSAMKKRMSRS